MLSSSAQREAEKAYEINWILDNFEKRMPPELGEMIGLLLGGTRW